MLLWSVALHAQDLALTKDSEFGFQHLIRSAQRGDLGADVTNANVGVSPNRVEIELIRPGAVNKHLYLTPKTSTSELSTYFDVELGEGATAADAARVGKVLDAAFADDPFEVASGFFGPQAMSHAPSFADAWRDGGWQEVWRALEVRVTAPTGRAPATAIAVLLAIASIASLIVLWGGEP